MVKYRKNVRELPTLSTTVTTIINLDFKKDISNSVLLRKGS